MRCEPSVTTDTSSSSPSASPKVDRSTASTPAGCVTGEHASAAAGSSSRPPSPKMSAPGLGDAHGLGDGDVALAAIVSSHV